MSNSELELKVESRIVGGRIVSDTKMYIEDEDNEAKRDLVYLAETLNRRITERHSNYLIAQRLGYYVYPIEKLELKG